MTSPTKTLKSKTFQFLVETRRLSESFKDLSSSIAHSAGELWHLPKLVKYTFRGILLKTKNLFFEP